MLKLRLDNHGHDGLGLPFWGVCITLLLCLAMTSAYAGMDSGYRDAAKTQREEPLKLIAALQQQESFSETLWKRCLKGNRVEPTLPGCWPVAQYIKNQANAAERDFSHGN